MMGRPSRYVVDLRWTLLLEGIGLSPQDVLRQARLPRDLFLQDNASLSSEEYLRLWTGIETLADDPCFPLTLVTAAGAESFSPPLYAALCSEDLNAALHRLASYKPLIGPMRLRIEACPGAFTSVTILGLPEDRPPPTSLLAAELAFFTHLARLGTRQRIVPVKLQSPVALADPAYAAFFGRAVETGPHARLVFAAVDANRPFLTASASMRAAFLPVLEQKLAALAAAPSMRDRTRAWLFESIASGQCSAARAAKDLGVSTRTLQRRLAEEDTSFQAELAEMRQDLAKRYLTKTGFATAEIAFLLGYAEPNSFHRAFRDWTGTTPEALRRQGATAAPRGFSTPAD